MFLHSTVIPQREEVDGSNCSLWKSLCLCQLRFKNVCFIYQYSFQGEVCSDFCWFDFKNNFHSLSHCFHTINTLEFWSFICSESNDFFQVEVDKLQELSNQAKGQSCAAHATHILGKKIHLHNQSRWFVRMKTFRGELESMTSRLVL